MDESKVAAKLGNEDAAAAANSFTLTQVQINEAMMMMVMNLILEGGDRRCVDMARYKRHLQYSVTERQTKSVRDVCCLLVDGAEKASALKPKV